MVPEELVCQAGALRNDHLAVLLLVAVHALTEGPQDQFGIQRREHDA